MFETDGCLERCGLRATGLAAPSSAPSLSPRPRNKRSHVSLRPTKFYHHRRAFVLLFVLFCFEGTEFFCFDNQPSTIVTTCVACFVVFVGLSELNPIVSPSLLCVCAQLDGNKIKVAFVLVTKKRRQSPSPRSRDAERECRRNVSAACRVLSAAPAVRT